MHGFAFGFAFIIFQSPNNVNIERNEQHTILYLNRRTFLLEREAQRSSKFKNTFQDHAERGQRVFTCGTYNEGIIKLSTNSSSV